MFLLFSATVEESGGLQNVTRFIICVCDALTSQVGLEASFAHELSDDVDRLSSGAHGQQLDELRVVEALQCLDLLHELILLRVLCRTTNSFHILFLFGL